MVKPFINFCALILLGAPVPASSEEVLSEAGYHLGRGFPVANTGLTLGGYTNLEVVAPHGGGAHFELSDLSLFLTWQAGERWRFFSEVELENGLEVAEEQGFTTGEASLRLERLYGDYSFAEALNVRLGKYLTPVSRWNLIHADPLVWTTSRPVVTERIFSQHATGAMLFGDTPLLGHELEYQLFTSVLDDPAPRPRDADFDKAYGLRAAYGDPGHSQLGFSYTDIRSNYPFVPEYHLFGMDGFWSRERYELSGEFFYRRADGKIPTQDVWGLYAQAVFPLSQRLYFIARQEVYQGEFSDQPAQLWIGGLAYKPVPPVVFKLEYGDGLHKTPETPVGFAASISVLF
ncbi:MAG: hypothetical protein EPN21_11295 [Methylococcaceae bacterium]|nr:MAG: hypothetical protein EPN21_11295 [Methylococcaceae bacterium]